MFSPLTRRHFVTGAAGASALAAVGDFNFLGSLPSLSAAVPSTRSAISAIVSSFSSARAGAANWRPTGIPARSRPTGIVIAQRPR